MDRELFDEAERFIESLPTSGPGFLYVLYGEGTPYIKIGSGENVAARIASLQTGCPHKLRLLFSVFCDDARGLETLMHDYFAEYRMHGDWFQLPEDTPRNLDLLAFLYSQSTRAVQRDEQQQIILDNEDEVSRILEVSEAENALTIQQILQRLGLDDTHNPRLRVIFLASFTKGALGKTGGGNIACTEKATRNRREVTANGVGLEAF